MNIPVLDLKPQYESIKEEIHQAISRVLESGCFIMGSEVQLFEEEVASYLGVKHAIGVNSGTDALVIGLRALGIRPRDEVITTPFSFFATAESISNVGAKPVFVDVSLETFNIDPNLIEAAITENTKAILPVHLYGRPAAMVQILDIAKRYNLKVIEDCAQAFGARYWGDCLECKQDCAAIRRDDVAGRCVGTLGHVGAFSFFPSKNLGAYGDGGMIVTDDDEVAEVARMLRVHGARKKYHNELLGYNSRLDALQAAILRVKLKYIDQWNEARLHVAQTYNQYLGGHEGLSTPSIVRGHVFHQYTIRVPGKRDQLATMLKSQGIGTMVYYPVPQDRLPVYQDQHPACPISDILSKQSLSLPIWPELTSDMACSITKRISQMYEC
jgi:dTDP-4-amino-4,6-dideoxygalactose transaminase